MRVTVVLFVIGTLGMVPKGLKRALEELEIRRQIETFQTIEISYNTKKSPEDLKSLDVTQIIVKDHQLM